MAAQFRRFSKQGRSLKYGNTRSRCLLGHSHASQFESAICAHLSAREQAGEIRVEQSQDHVYLTLARIGCIPDFKCIDVSTGQQFWVEAKGFETERWLIIKKLWTHYGPGKLEIWKGSATKFRLAETIVPTTIP